MKWGEKPVAEGRPPTSRSPRSLVVAHWLLVFGIVSFCIAMAALATASIRLAVSFGVLAILAPVYSAFLYLRLIRFAVTRMDKKLRRQLAEIEAAASASESANWDELGFAMDGIQLTIEEGLAKLLEAEPSSSKSGIAGKTLLTGERESTYSLLAEYLCQPGKSLLVGSRDGLGKLSRALSPSVLERVKLFDVTDSSAPPLFEIGRYSNIVIWLEPDEHESSYRRQLPLSWISETSNLYFGPSAQDAKSQIRSITYGTPVRIAFGDAKSDIYPATIVRSLEG